MNYTFKQISPDKTTYEIAESATFILSFSIVATILSVGLILLINNKLYLILIFPLIFSKLLIRRNLKDWPKKKDQIGEVMFTETSFFLKTKKPLYP